MIRRRQKFCIDQLLSIASGLIEDLTKGKGCLVETDNEMERFDCSSILLGNAILAMHKYMRSKLSDKSSWIASPTSMCDWMKGVAEGVNGPARSIIQGRYNYRTYDYSPHHHTSCSRQSEVSGQINAVHNDIVSGMKLAEFGNSEFRALVAQHEEHQARDTHNE